MPSSSQADDPQVTNPTGVDIVSSDEALSVFLKPEESPTCAIDTEADSLHRYRESLCLVQFADRNRKVLIDPLAIEDLSPLADYLVTATVWMHGADYDMTMLKREFGKLPAHVFDTQIGARLLGERRFGLGDLVLRYFNVQLSKSSQKADWGKRPLTPKMIEYAINDVAYLLEMGDIIMSQLQAKGRHEWFLESCEAARQKVLDRDDSREDSWRIQGSGKLDRKGLSYLKGIWEWRDAEAGTWDRPSFMVATNRDLIEWSTQLSEGKSIKLPRHFRPDRQKRFRSVVEQIAALPESDWPERPSVKRRKRDRAFDQRLDELLKARDTVAAELDIDGSLIAPRAVLETIAEGHVSPHELLLNWQIGCLKLA